jgi:FkbM family methyltransferase
MAGKPRVLFLQFANPAAYPPLEHASRILADKGWEVRFLGVAAQDTAALTFPPHPSIRLRLLPRPSRGLRLKLAYAGFLLRALATSLVWRPRLVYASDPIVCPAALALRLVAGRRILYHEHDALPACSGRLPERLLHAARRRLGRAADICVVPQQRRLEAFLEETGRRGPAFRVWNCPRLEEVAPPRCAAPAGARPMSFYFHGSLNAVRLPGTVLDALAQASPDATLTVVGYETVGSRGYMRAFLERARRLGLSERVRYPGALARSEMLQRARQADVGLAFVPPPASGDINMAHMTGASNKPFDYLAVGLMPLVSDLPDWRQMYVAPGYARACDPADPHSLAAAFAWCIANPEEVRAMAERGRQMITREWNYETAFAPVVEHLADRERDRSLSAVSEPLTHGERIVVRALRLIPPGTRGKMRLARLLLPLRAHRSGRIVTLASGEQLSAPSLHEPVAFHCLVDGTYEPELTALLERYLPPGGTFLDVGANIGVFTLTAARIAGPLGRVIAIEASPEIGGFLSRNIAANGCPNVTLVAKAAAENGPQRLAFWPAPAEKFGMGALAPQFDAAAIAVDADTIDNIVTALDIAHVDLIKMDIEGFEAAALRGARRLLSSSRPPPVIIEFADWAENRAGARCGDAQRVLQELGYKLKLIRRDGRLQDLTEPLARGSASILAVPSAADDRPATSPRA